MVHLVKKSRPDAPTLLGPVESMSDSLLVKWKENFHGGYKNVTFKLQYRPQGNFKVGKGVFRNDLGMY